MLGTKNDMIMVKGGVHHKSQSPGVIMCFEGVT